MTPADLYRTCRTSAWRLEALQHYSVASDEERQRAFHVGEPLPPPGPGKLDDLALITGLHRAGRRIGRVHVVDRPLSPYVRYELAVYPENAAAGEDIRIADRSVHPELESLTGDFALFDAETGNASVVFFDYDVSGTVRGYRVTTDRQAIGACREKRDLALSHSVPLADFMAATSR